jgi:hypothetical protein
MSYANLYTIPFTGRLGIEGYIYIDQLDYQGIPDPTMLRMEFDSLQITYSFGDWGNPVIPLQCEFNLLNDKEDFFELLPLISAQERQFKVRVVLQKPEVINLFDGFLNSEAMSQKYLKRQFIKFVSSNYLAKLEDNYPDSIDILQTKTFIDIIDEILTSNGSSFNIRINSKLHAEGDILQIGQTLFNKNGFYTEVFWDDLVNRKYSLDILKDILTSFDCYIYWQDGYWYIERYEDLWSENGTYVEYVTGSKYSPSDSGNAIAFTKSIEPVHFHKFTKKGLLFTEQTQTIGTDPGYKTIKIILDDKRFLNLIRAHFDDVSLATIFPPEPPLRTWLKYQIPARITWNIWSPYSTIQDTFRRLIYPDFGEYIDNYKGLYTSFIVSVQNTKTQLNIKFKYGIEKRTDGDSWDNWSFNFYWYLRVANTTDYIFKVGDTEDWLKQPGANENEHLQTISVSGSTLDKDSNVMEVSVSIPIGLVSNYVLGLDVGTLNGDIPLVFCLGTENVTKDTEEDQVWEAFIGDFEITSTGEVQPNVIEGKVNSNYLNKKDISLILYDCDSANYKNSILRGDSLNIRTLRWGTDGGVSLINSRGVCWAIHHTPTINDSKTIDGTGFGVFESKMTGLSEGTTYYVRAYAIDGDGAVFYGEEETFTTIDMTIGSAYEGGKIAYIYQPGDNGYVEGEFHGIICALSDAKTPDGDRDFWCSLSNGMGYSCGAWDTEINKGKDNSTKMDDHPWITQFAIKECIGCSYAGYTDWVLPSIDELIKLRDSRGILGGFSNGWYWSSTEFSKDQNPPKNVLIEFWLAFKVIFGSSAWKYAWGLDFSSGSSAAETYKKNNWMRIRPIRYF